MNDDTETTRRGGAGGGKDQAEDEDDDEARDEAEEQYAWELPDGDLSVDAIGFAFNELRAGRCPDDLNVDEFTPADRSWLYRSAIAVCSGDYAAAHA